MVRLVGDKEPETARAALRGLTAYEDAPRHHLRSARSVAAQIGPAILRDHGGTGPPAVLVPSLINPPHVLDLDEQVSLASAVARMGRRALLLDWSAAGERSELDVSGHVEKLLVPLLSELQEGAAVIGYCLGGTMAIAAANLAPVERVVTLAAPWRFSAYPLDARSQLLSLWRGAEAASTPLKGLPMEVLQAAFWSLDPKRTVAKFADFSDLAPESAEARRFVALEDWANEGEPLPLPAARELIEDFFGADFPGSDRWTIGGRAMTDQLSVPVLHLTAGHDRIAPAETVAGGAVRRIPAGHVGMIVGSARRQLHGALAAFLDPACRSPT